MPNTPFTRRKLLQTLSLSTMFFSIRSWAARLLPRRSGDFHFVFLGDLHFDSLAYHDPHYLEAKYPHDIGQIQNYSRVTRDNLPGLMQASKAHANAIHAKFFLQIGDFVEGLCGSKELASLQTSDLIRYVDQQNFQRPFLAIKGNHDITGIGAKDVFNEVVLPWQSREFNRSLTSANNVYVYKNARFILFDCFTEKESLTWLRQVIKEHQPSETLFFCTHIPVVPYNARANWLVYVHPEQAAEREELLNLLGAHKAIVLSGHLHKTSIVVRSTPFGNFVQLALGSVVPALDAQVKDHLMGLDAYNADLVNLEPDFSPATLELRQQLLEREKPFIRYYEYADFCGYASLRVSAHDGVVITYFANADTRPWLSTNVSNLLKS